MAVKILAQTLQVSNHCQFPYSQTEKKHLETHPSQPKVTNWVALERWLERHRRGGPRSCWRDNTSLWMGRQCPVQEMPYPEYVGTGRDTGTTRHLFFFFNISQGVLAFQESYFSYFFPGRGCGSRFGSPTMTSKSSRWFWRDPTLQLVAQRFLKKGSFVIMFESADI